MTLRSGRDLRQREQIGELPVRHPMLHVDGEAVHFRHGRIGAADREQRQQREVAGEHGQLPAVGLHRGLQYWFATARAMLTGATMTSTSGSDHCITPTAAQVNSAMSGPTTARVLEQRRRHFRDGCRDQPGGGRRHAGEHMAHRRQIAEAGIQHADERHQHHRRNYEARQRGDAAERSAHARAEHDREIPRTLGPGRKLQERVGLVELLRRHPAALLHHHAPRPRQHAADSQQRDGGEGDEQFGQRRLRRRLGGSGVHRLSFSAASPALPDAPSQASIASSRAQCDQRPQKRPGASCCGALVACCGALPVACEERRRGESYTTCAGESARRKTAVVRTIAASSMR